MTNHGARITRRLILNVGRIMMNDYPLSVFVDATRSTLGGIITFFAGLMLGAAIVFSEGVYTSNNWIWYAIAWLFLLPYTIAKLWGLILAPILAIIFIGMVWYDWNRLIGLGIVALLTALTVFLSAKHNPITDSDSLLAFSALVGVCVACIVIGMAIEIMTKSVQQENGGDA